MKLKEFFIDIGSSVTSFVTDVLDKSGIPGLALGSLIIKRGIETYEANQYLKNEGIKDLVVCKHLCNNIEVLVSRQHKTEELTYVFSIYTELRKKLDKLLKVISGSLYNDVLQKFYEDYPGKDKKTDSIDKIIKLELIPSIVHFINTELGDTKIFNSFVDMHLAAFDEEQSHEVWVEIWQASGFNIVYNLYSEFLEAQVKAHKSLLTGKLSKANQDKLEDFKKNMEKWQLYMDTLSSCTQIEDIHLFLINYKSLRSVAQRPSFDIVKFSKKFMVDPIMMQRTIAETIQTLDLYIDALLTITRVNQTGGAKKRKSPVKVKAPVKSKSKSKTK